MPIEHAEDHRQGLCFDHRQMAYYDWDGFVALWQSRRPIGPRDASTAPTLAPGPARRFGSTPFASTNSSSCAHQHSIGWRPLLAWVQPRLQYVDGCWDAMGDAGLSAAADALDAADHALAQAAPPGRGQIVDGVVALPAGAENREQLEWLAEEVAEAGGDATIWLSVPATAAQQRGSPG